MDAKSGYHSLNILAESLDELTELAATLFSPVLNRGQDSAPLILDHPFGKDEMGVCQSSMLTSRYVQRIILQF